MRQEALTTMARSGRKDLLQANSKIEAIERQVAIQRDLINALKSSGRDTARAELSLAMLLASLRQAELARDAMALAAKMRARCATRQ